MTYDTVDIMAIVVNVPTTRNKTQGNYQQQKYCVHTVIAAVCFTPFCGQINKHSQHYCVMLSKKCGHSSVGDYAVKYCSQLNKILNLKYQTSPYFQTASLANHNLGLIIIYFKHPLRIRPLYVSLSLNQSLSCDAGIRFIGVTHPDPDPDHM